MKRVGYWVHDKKKNHYNFSKFSLLCRQSEIELVKLNLDQPLEEQGPFDLIFHKLAKLDPSTERTLLLRERFQEYARSHPEVIILDPLDNLSLLLDRHRQYQVMRYCDIFTQDSSYLMPRFVQLKKTLCGQRTELIRDLLTSHDISFPIICKPRVTHGSRLAHKMVIVFNEQGLHDIPLPCVAQSFVKHNGVLYKVFVIGDNYFVVKRPSIKNLYPGDHNSLSFDTHEVCKSHSRSALSECNEDVKSVSPDYVKLRRMAHAIQATFHLDLFGIDVVVENTTGKYAILDINSFPGYDGVPDFLEELLHLINTKLNKKSDVHPT